MNDLNPPALVQQAEESLADLARQINSAEERAVRSIVEHARGQGEALLKAKARCGHGKWLPWLRENVRVKERQARNYMAIAREWDRVKSAVTADLTVEGALRLITAEAEDPAPVAPPTQGEMLARADEAFDRALVMARQDFASMRAVIDKPDATFQELKEVADRAAAWADLWAEENLRNMRAIGRVLAEPNAPPEWRPEEALAAADADRLPRPGGEPSPTSEG